MGTSKKILLLILSITICPMLLADNLPWKQKSSFQFAKEISLSELIRGYFALQSITVVIDKDIQGTVNGKFQDLSPEEFLNRLARANGLIWCYVANVVYVYPAQKVESKFLEINSLASKKLLGTISGLGMVAPTSSIRLIEPSNIAFVSGPPKYVEIVTDIADRLSKTLETGYSEVPQVRIFPLQHAWAYDTTFTTQEKQVTLPGLATILRGLMQTGVNVSPEMVVSGAVTTNRIQVANKIETFTQQNGLVKEHNKEVIKENDFNPAILPPVPPLDSLSPTLIQPDIRLNAIIVRDVEKKMPQYEAIIKALDVAVFLIEISVAIVDIDSNFSSAIGNVLFKATNRRDPTNKFIQITPAQNTTTLVNQLTSNIQTGAVWDGWNIISNIEALASEGYANIVARPSVLTLNNIEAEIARTETFYVELQGKDSSDLASVTVGTDLKVTPRVIVEEDGSRKIKLLVNLHDGAVDTASTQTTTLPRTTDNVIYTQAVILEGQSLFIGGYYRQEKGASESGIPLLKDIPILGYIFKVRSKSNTIVERMYLITPRVINLDFERAPNITDMICDNTPPPMGIAHEMAERNYNVEHGCAEPYAEDLQCTDSHGCFRRKTLRGQFHRYFD